MFYVREGLKIMEEDFDSLSANSKFVSLEDLLRECTHQLRTRTRPVERGCDNCGRLGCEFVCPHPGCRFDVCGHCWQEGLQAHIVPPGGLGPKRKREVSRLIPLHSPLVRGPTPAKSPTGASSSASRPRRARARSICRRNDVAWCFAAWPQCVICHLKWRSGRCKPMRVATVFVAASEQ